MGTGYSHDDLIRVMADMPEKYRAVISMRFIRGYDDETIADNTGISIGEIRCYKTKAMRLLRNELNNMRRI